MTPRHPAPESREALHREIGRLRADIARLRVELEALRQARDAAEVDWAATIETLFRAEVVPHVRAT